MLLIQIRMVAQSVQVDSASVVSINPEIGNVIDLKEKLQYSLFSYYPKSTYAYASLYEKKISQDSSSQYFLIVHFNDSTIEKRKVSPEEVKNILWLANVKEVAKEEKIKKENKKRASRGLSDTTFYKLKNNSIYGSAIPVPLLFLSLNVTYERILLQRNKRYFRSLGVRATGGVWAGWESAGPYGMISASGLWGPQNSHFEACLGVADIKNTYYANQNYISPTFALGYRYQEPEENFVFRIGSGFPELFYVSLGVAF